MFCNAVGFEILISRRPARSTPWLSVALVGLALFARDASPAVIYRIGAPLTAAEKDSLDGLGIEFREIQWSASQLEEALEPDSLLAGSVQPNFLDEDEDIAATLLDRGGRIWIDVFGAPNALIAQVLLDSDPATDYTWFAVAPESFNVNIRSERLTLDLGGQFLVRELRMRPAPDKPEQFLEHFNVGIGDRNELFLRSGRFPQFPQLLDIKENSQPEVSVPFDPPIATSAVQLQIFRQTPKEIGLADFEVYGGGFVDRAAYHSDVIELDDNASWGEISWAGRRDPGARVEIRTRTGTDPQPEVFWEARPEQQDSVQFLQGGGDLSLTEYKREYARLSDFLKPVDAANQVGLDTENWSFWSNPYDFEDPGAAIASPGPRKFIQLKADFVSSVEDGGKIDYMQFNASVPPSVRRLLGEISPVETEVGRPTRFTYYIRPTIRSGDSSFDGVEISTPSGVVSVDSLRLAGVDQGEFSSTIRADGLGFEVQLPRRLEPTDSGALLEILFNAPVLREVGTLFAGKVFDTSKPNEVRQRVIPGNASDGIVGDRLSVTTSFSNSVVFSPDVSPNPFTPNGDGINDAVTIRFSLLRVTSAVPVSIEIFDLSGRLITRVYAGDDPLGEYTHTWDGTNQSRNRVPPGLYLYRLVVDVQSDKETYSGIISVAL